MLRGGAEQHLLKQSQFTRFPEDYGLYDETAYYEYAENGSKNRQGRFEHVQAENKVVTAYAQPGSKKCIVKLLYLYMSKLPIGTISFYLRPCAKVPEDETKSWYVKQNVGINKLRDVVAEMSVKAKLPIRYTNHSLRATAITRMYEGGVPEKVISDKSGHKSIKGLRTYERTSKEQDRFTCSVIAQLDESCDKDEEALVKSETSKLKEDNTQHKLAPLFSGQVSNCTFIFNYSS